MDPARVLTSASRATTLPQRYYNSRRQVTPHDDEPALGERELDLLQVLWKRGDATVGEVQQSLAAAGAHLAYTTVQTMLNRLEAKGIVARRSGERAHVYHAVAQQGSVVGSAIGRLASRFFGGRVEDLATHLVEQGLEPEELERLHALIEAQRSRRRP
jgi:BlaI family transcriptional regulator, penicillinase repressor